MKNRLVVPEVKHEIGVEERGVDIVTKTDNSKHW